MNGDQCGRRTALLATMACAFPWVVPDAAPAQVYLTAAGGAEIPTGNLGESHQPGANFDLELGYEVARRVGIGVFGSLGLLGGETLGPLTRFGDAQVWRYGVDGQVQAVNPAMSNLRVILGAGLGGATSSVDPGLLAGRPLPAGSETNFMLAGKVYFGYGMAQNVMIGVGGRFYIIFSDDPRLAGGTDMTSFTLQAMIAWRQR
jgi:hypothetical protein